MLETASGGVVVAHPFPEPALVAVERIVEPLPVFLLCVYAPSEWYVTAVDDWIELEARRSETRPTLVEGFDPLPTGPAVKVMAIGEPGNLRLVTERLAPKLGQKLYWFYSYPEYLEIMPLGISKGRACREIRDRLRIGTKRVMAIGDGANDTEMFGEAGVRVAVENAVPQLARIAPTTSPLRTMTTGSLSQSTAWHWAIALPAHC